MKRIRRCAHAERTTIRAFVAIVLVAPCSLAQSDRLPRHAVLGASAVDRDGVRVSALRPGGAAERSGLHVEDVIVSIGGRPVHTLTEYVASVKAAPSDGPALFQITRGDATLSLPVVLDAAPNETDAMVDTLYQTVVVDSSLRRTLLTVPRGVQGQRPAVLILGGIGCYSIDNATDPQDG
jgi:PDZ domain